MKYRILHRLKNRIKFCFRMINAKKWDGESCKRCGCNSRTSFSLSNAKWLELMSKSNHNYSVLCLNCTMEMCSQFKVSLEEKDFGHLYLIPYNNTIQLIENVGETKGNV